MDITIYGGEYSHRSIKEGQMMIIRIYMPTHSVKRSTKLVFVFQELWFLKLAHVLANEATDMYT